jgi:nucleotide-binding universal stress UspA family protein
MSTRTLRTVTESSAVILDELEALHPEWAPLPVPAEAAEQPVVIPGTDPVQVNRPVLVAVDDDDNVSVLLRQGSAMAEQLGVPMRAAYVWADCRTSDCAEHRHCHRDLGEASRLLTMLLDEFLVIEPMPPIEREVLCAGDPVEALIALSAAASILVVGSSSHRPVPGDALGDTTRQLLGRTRCPVVVVPHHRLSATRATW